MNKNKLGILLVEDDMVDVMNVKRAFKKNSLECPLFVAGNGVEALKMLRGEGTPKPDPFPNLILLDLNMPLMNGIEFLKEVRKDPKLRHFPVFILSTSIQNSDVEAAYSLNVAGYIMKPLSFDQFVTTVATLQNYWNLIEYTTNGG